MNYLLIICTLFIGHSIFLSMALLISNRKTSNRLLAILILLLTLRIGKSIIGMFLARGMIYELSAIGVISMAAIGPVLLLLVKSLFNSLRVSRHTFIQFIPAALLIPTLPLSDWKILSPAYYLITVHVWIYIILSWVFIFKNQQNFKADDLKWKWSLFLLSGVSILGATFILQISVYQPIIYATNIIVAALVFYGLSLYAIKRSKFFLEDSKTVKPEHSEEYEKLGKQIQRLLDVDELFIDSNLTVTSLATKLKSPPYLISKTINYYFRKSFSELLIQYRIKKAEQLLLSPESKAYTIESVAFESGFNTLSAFYSSFKKIHKMTPAQFRSAKGISNMKIA